MELSRFRKIWLLIALGGSMQRAILSSFCLKNLCLQQMSSPTKKRRSSTMALKKTHTDHPSALLTFALASTELSIGSHRQHYYSHPRVQTYHHRADEYHQSTRNQHQDSTLSYNVSLLMHKFPPRRPSLWSILQIGQKNKTSVVGLDSSMDSMTQVQTASKSSDQSSTMEED